MQSKLESITVIVALLVALTSSALQDFLHLNVFIVSYASVEFLWAYAIYWAFNTRRAVSATLYRNQALGIGLVAIAWLSFELSFYSVNPLLNRVALSLAILITFYWIDSSVLISRKSDPLYRNTLRWKEVRLVVWPLLIALVIILFPSWHLINPLAPLNPSKVPRILGDNPSLLSVVSLDAGILLLLGSGTLYLVVAALRSKDRMLKSQLMWFGIFFVAFFGFILLWTFTYHFVFIILAYASGAYSVYRSAKSLSPLNQMPKKLAA